LSLLALGQECITVREGRERTKGRRLFTQAHGNRQTICEIDNLGEGVGSLNGTGREGEIGTRRIESRHLLLRWAHSYPLIDVRYTGAAFILLRHISQMDSNPEISSLDAF